MSVVERVVGGALIALILGDVFLTVLYARMGTGILSPYIGKGVWRAFLFVAHRAGNRGMRALSYCGPAVLVALLAVWVLGLTLGAALTIHGALGSAVEASSGVTRHDFITALIAGGNALDVVGAAMYPAESVGYKLLYLFLSLIGLSITTLTLTYLMQVYAALLRRNALGMRMHLMTAETDDAAEMLAGLGPEGQFANSYSILHELGSDMAAVNESHHLYPVLFYFRFDRSYYSVAQCTLLALDAVSLVRSALDERKLGWLQESSATTLLWRGSMTLVRSLEDNFFPNEKEATLERDPQVLTQWHRRFEAALDRLEQASISITRDPVAGFEIYRALRSEWNVHVMSLARAMAFDLAEIDPATAEPQRSERRMPFAMRRHAAG